jgi:hypothetical protein
MCVIGFLDTAAEISLNSTFVTLQLRHVLHDWGMSECMKILGNVRKSMAPHSRLLVRQ